MENLCHVYRETFVNSYGVFVILLHMARRPLRVALALIAGGFWDWMVHSLKQRFKVNQVIAVMIVAFVVDIIGSFILVTIGASVAEFTNRSTCMG
jgi:ABC-type uncharacterized transport system permease subunit